MTALQLSTQGLGYGPARLARLESERSMRRALPVSSLLVAGALLALAGAARLAPSAAVVFDTGRIREHGMVGLVDPRPAPVTPRVRLTPALPRAGHVPLPVPDATALAAAEPEAAGSALADDGAAGGGGGGAGLPAGAGGLGPDPVPGDFVYTDQVPVRVQSFAPEYPDMAREAGVEGTVLLWALVDLDGSVKAVQVIRSVPLLDGAASAALRRWRFTPALANGHPVRVWVAVPVRFSLH